MAVSSTRSVRLGLFQGQFVEIAGQSGRSMYFRFNSLGWRPAINAYLCDKCIRVCVDLAGVDGASVEVLVEPRRLFVRGQRKPPEPLETNHRSVRVLALEIDWGPFEREILLEAEVEPRQVTTEQCNGLLWVLLPLRTQA